MLESKLVEASHPKPYLLFVEDESTVREHLARALSDEYIVSTAANGTEALLCVMKRKPALVITDIVMPGMDGVELLKTLRHTPGTEAIPVLLISGRAADEHRIEGFNEGADAFLAKPYTVRELRALVGSMLNSARKRAEVAAREAREQAEQKAVLERAALLESITDAFYALDRGWRFTYVNQRAADYYGKQPNDLLGKNFWEVFPMARGSVLEIQYERALRNNCSVSFEAVSPITHRWVDVRAYPTPHGLAVSFRDISERKRTEQELRDTLDELHAREEQLRANELQLALEVDSMRRLHGLVTKLLRCNDLQTALEEVLSASLALMETDMGNVQLFEPDTRTLRIAVHRGLGRDFLDLFQQVGADTPAACARAARQARATTIEDVDTDPEFAPYRRIAAIQGFRAVHSTPVTSRTGELLGVLSTHFREPHSPPERALRMIELYARQAADFLERVQADDALKLADRRKTEFLAVLAHELRSPLAPLRNGLQILRLRASTDELSQRTMSMMDRQLSQMVRLVDDLLDVSRITRGHITLKRERMCLTEALATAIEAARPHLEAHGHELAIDMRVQPPLYVDADRTRLSQVFSNLLSNSAKYTDQGGTVTLTVDREGTDVVTSVRDTGIGIPANALEDVFDLFAQVKPQDSRSQSGMGIGLSLVRRLSDLHGGSVSATSEGLGKGSTFTVRLPLAQADDPELFGVGATADSAGGTH
jgi:PAS domain S-box-containing protein